MSAISPGIDHQALHDQGFSRVFPFYFYKSFPISRIIAYESTPLAAIRLVIPISVSITLLRSALPHSERIHEIFAGFAFRATFPVFLREADDGLHLPDEVTTVFADEQMQTKLDPRTRSKFTVDIGVSPFGYFATIKQFEHSLSSRAAQGQSHSRHHVVCSDREMLQLGTSECLVMTSEKCGSKRFASYDSQLSPR